VPYYLLTVTVPAELCGVFLRYPVEMVPVFFAAMASALKALCARRKFLGGNIGFTAILHTWSRRMLFHPHIHVLVPAVGLAQNGCELRHPRNQEYLLPEKALRMRHARQSMRRSLAIIPRSLRESSPPPGRSPGWPRFKGGRTRTHGFALPRGVCEEVGLQRRQAAGVRIHQLRTVWMYCQRVAS
jgi:hypothetical protein